MRGELTSLVPQRRPLPRLSWPQAAEVGQASQAHFMLGLLCLARSAGLHGKEHVFNLPRKTIAERVRVIVEKEKW